MTSRPSTAAPILAALAIVLVLLLALYVFSIGPAYASQHISADTFHSRYDPVINGAHAIGLSDLVVWYCDTWAAWSGRRVPAGDG